MSDEEIQSRVDAAIAAAKASKDFAATPEEEVVDLDVKDIMANAGMALAAASGAISQLHGAVMSLAQYGTAVKGLYDAERRRKLELMMDIAELKGKAKSSPEEEKESEEVEEPDADSQ